RSTSAGSNERRRTCLTSGRGRNLALREGPVLRRSEMPIRLAVRRSPRPPSFAIAAFVLACAAHAHAQASDPPCANYQAWQIQANPRSDTTRLNNSAYPEANATYWATILGEPTGTTLVARGQYPL